MIKVDDRIKKNKQDWYWGVVARDKFLSGWGKAKNGYSRCAWACKDYNDAEKVLKWVENRSEMQYVSIVDLRTYRPPSNTAHFHIYVADEGHTGLV